MSTSPLRILIVDDNKDHQHLMKESIEESIKDVYIEFSDTGKECLFKLSEETYSILIIDFSLSETSGLKLFRNVIQNKIDIPVIMVTGFGNENVAVEAMKLGAYDYIVKSDAYLEKLSATILKVVKEHGLRKEKKEIESKLIESELRYRTLIEDVIDIVFMMDKELNIVSINPACQKIFECSKADAMKGNLYKLIYETDREMIIDYFKRSFSSKRELIEALEFRIRTERGNIKYVEMNAKVNYGEDDDVIQIEGVIRDITERKKIEQKLYQMDKLNALELQSNGIAHEFNNILGIILGYLNILRLRLEDPNQKISDALNIIEKAAKDGATIVDKIQQFSKTKPEYEGIIHVDLIDVINEAVEFTIPRWKSEAQLKGIEYEVITDNLVDSRYYVKCNPSELREVIVNIINNSIDAMPDGGKIEFSAKTDNESVVVSVSDNGIGIKEEFKDKIFDPFFTTKDVKRSGLGLSVVHSIVKRYDGVINIDSCWGKGTTIHIKMPLCLRELTKSKKKEGPVSDYKADILIIEDEEVILDMMKIILEKRGHKVFIAKDSNDGMKMYENNKYDVVLCDLAMPKVNGWRVAKYIKDIDAIRKMAKTPFVLITGYELDTDNLNYRKEGVDFILKKPLEFDELNKMIYDLIMERR
ncbi:MAG: response regulator [Candidatus Scalinduaceae bacterium]